MPPLSPPPAAGGSAGSPPTTLLWSYGANMAASTLARRGVAPLSSEPAVAADRDLWLSFGHRSGYACVDRRRPPAELQHLCWQQPHGVLHRVTAADLARLQAREVGYKIGQLAVLTYAGELLTAAAFLSSPLLRLAAPVPPPLRYRALLLEGCRQHGLDPDLIAWLEQLEVAPPGPLDSRYDACPANALAKGVAVGAAAAAAWAAAHAHM